MCVVYAAMTGPTNCGHRSGILASAILRAMCGTERNISEIASPIRMGSLRLMEPSRYTEIYSKRFVPDMLKSSFDVVGLCGKNTAVCNIEQRIIASVALQNADKPDLVAVCDENLSETLLGDHAD